MKASEQALYDVVNALADRRRADILTAGDDICVDGITYYVSNHGNDASDGLTPQTAWKTLEKVSAAPLKPGDGVLFCRGDLFRGFVKTAPGVTYAAYGTGEKPKFYGWERDLADPALWEAYDSSCDIWHLKSLIPDCGTLVFDHGHAHAVKCIPSYRNGKFLCRGEEEREFVIEKELKNELDMVCLYDTKTTTVPSKGESFPVPLMEGECFGALYLKHKGNPGAAWSSIEALPRRSMFLVGENENVRLDNLSLKYIGIHAVAAYGHVKGLHIGNCEIGWIGGCIQHYLGLDPNNRTDGRGRVTRYGNGVEIYGGCEDYTVENCYIYEVYDAGITHQVSTQGKHVDMKHIRYAGNLIENCVYSIEYFLEKTDGDRDSLIEDCIIENNILRTSGEGWGYQRPNKETPAHIKGWNYENTARHFSIKGNIFDRSREKLIHIVAEDEQSLPHMEENTYLQYKGESLGLFGSRIPQFPTLLRFDNGIEAAIRDTVGEKNAKVCILK